MCETVINEKLIDGRRSVVLTCKKTGKSLSRPTRYGIFCEDMCDYEEKKKEMEDTFNKILDIDKRWMFGGEK
jgi:hypothetical protein